MAPAYDIVVVFFMALRVGGRSRATAGAGAASVAAGAAGGAAAAATSRSRFETLSRPASEFVRRVCVLVSGGDTIINSTIVDTKFSTKMGAPGRSVRARGAQAGGGVASIARASVVVRSPNKDYCGAFEVQARKKALAKL